MANSAAEEATAAASWCPRRRRVLLFPLPLQGHLNPMLQLADVLHSRDFAVTIFHAASTSPDPARRRASYRFVPVGAGDLLATGSGAVDIPGAVLRMNERLRATFHDLLREALAEADAPACLVVDSNLREMQLVAGELGVPTLVLRTGGAACFLAYTAFPALCEKGILPPPPQGDELDMAVDELPPLRRRDMVFSTTTKHATMSACLERLVEASRCSSGLIVNTFSELEAPELQRITAGGGVPAIYAVGPLHKIVPDDGGGEEASLPVQDRSCMEWLDRQQPESVLYVSVGSLASMNAEELTETAWGLTNSGVPFLWVIRPDMVRSSSGKTTELPDCFEEAVRRRRGMVVAWAPQQRVLRHRAVGGFWTHNGWNSTLESVGEGVPMICRPHFADQMINARYVEEVWKVGIGLGGGRLERRVIERAVRKLMVKGGEMRRRAADLKKKAAMAVQHGGSSQTAIDLLVDRIASFRLIKD